MLLVPIGRVLVILGLAFCSYVSFQWMVGDFYGERIALSLEQWAKHKGSHSKAVLLNHLEFSEQSLSWAPSNPRYKELRARLLVMQTPYLPNNKEVLASLEEMIGLHRAAIQERPQWPFSWANLAFMKGIKQEFDHEYRQALSEVVSFGPYEVGAIQRIVRSATSAWFQMDEKEELLIYQAIANGAEIDSRLARNLKKILIQKELLDEICNETRFHSEKSQKRLCG